MRLVASTELEGVTGHYFNGTRGERADDQAYDPEARARLREMSDELVGRSGS